jgi:hypothetical protein
VANLEFAAASGTSIDLSLKRDLELRVTQAVCSDGQYVIADSWRLWTKQPVSVFLFVIFLLGIVVVFGFLVQWVAREAFHRVYYSMRIRRFLERKKT